MSDSKPATPAVPSAPPSTATNPDMMQPQFTELEKLRKEKEILLKKLVIEKSQNLQLQAQIEDLKAAEAPAASSSSSGAVSVSASGGNKTTNGLGQVDLPDGSRVVIPSEDQLDALKEWLQGDGSRKMLKDKLLTVPDEILIDWLLWTGLHCKRLGKLLTLGQVATESMSMEQTMINITSEACKTLNAERATVFCIDTKRRELYAMIASKNVNEKFEDVKSKIDTGRNVSKKRVVRKTARDTFTIRIPDDEGIAGYVYQHGVTLNIPDAYDDYRFNQDVDKKSGLRTKAVLCTVVTAHGGVKMGVLQVMNRKDGGVFSSQDQTKAESLAVKVGVLLYRASQYDEAKMVQQGNPLLDEIMNSYVEEVSLEKCMADTVDEVRRVLDCERATVFLADTKTNTLFSILKDGTEIRFPWDKGLAGECFTTKKIINIPEPYKDKRFNPEFDIKNNFKTTSILCYPLRNSEAGVIGVVQAINRGPDESCFFTEEDEVYFARTATQAGSNLQYARMFEEVAHQEISH